MSLPAAAQVDYSFLSQTAPLPRYQTPDPARYNLKWGTLSARLSASVQAEFNDNINLSQDHPKADLSIGPQVGVGFVFPISQANVLHLDFGLGYRWYLNSPSINSFNVVPSTILEHNLFVRDVHINFHDSLTVQVDPASRPELSGTQNSLILFRRLVNRLGLMGDWRATQRLTFLAGYDYTFDRSLTSEYTQLDLSAHTFVAGFEYAITPRWNLGVHGTYTLTDYVQRYQNNSAGYTLGPVVTFHPNERVALTASVGYTLTQHDQTGLVTDRSEFTGITYQLGIQQKVNTRFTHDLRVGRSIDPGFGSNFTDVWDAQYGLHRRLTSAITLNVTLGYQIFAASGLGGEKANRYLGFAGTSYQVSRRWQIGLGYAFVRKDSDQAGRDYTQNRFTLDATRQF
jgi:long-subunit fatty acid transport protein